MKINWLKVIWGLLIIVLILGGINTVMNIVYTAKAINSIKKPVTVENYFECERDEEGNETCVRVKTRITE